MAELIEWSKERPMFNLNEAERATGYERSYLRKKLSRYAKKASIHRIERGKYTFYEDSLIYASHIEIPSYISLWSGLNFYNLTTQEPTKVQVVCSENRQNLDDIQFYSSNNVFGYEKIVYKGFEIFVAEKEKLLLDILNYGEVPLDEVDELVEEVDLQKLLEYAQRLGNKTVSRRAGYVVEKLRDCDLEGLNVQDSNYALLDLTKSDKGEINSKWRLKVNNGAF